MQNRYRQAIGHDVMGRDDEPVFRAVQTTEHGAEQAPCREVEGPGQLGFGKRLQHGGLTFQIEPPEWRHCAIARALPDHIIAGNEAAGEYRVSFEQRQPG